MQEGKLSNKIYLDRHFGNAFKDKLRQSGDA